MSKKKNICFIFARGGSKGLPKKNIKCLLNKPLISYAIETAKKCSFIDEVFVSTDDIEIAKISRQSNAIVPFLRPKELSLDTSPELDAWKHAINWYINNHGEFDLFISLPTTSPLRTAYDVDSCIKMMKNNLYIDGVITVSESKRNPFFNMVKTNKGNFIEKIFFNSKNINRRQDAPKVYDILTVAYVFRPKYLLSTDDILKGKIKSLLIPQSRSLDIDTLEDFEIAEFFMKKKVNENN